MGLGPGDVVTETCQPVDPLPTVMLSAAPTTEVISEITAVPGTAIFAPGMLIQVSEPRYGSILSAFQNLGLLPCNSNFAKPNSPLFLSVKINNINALITP